MSSDPVRYRRSLEALSRHVGPDVLVTTPHDEEVHELSGGASALWNEVHVPRTMAELIDGLAVAHHVGPGKIDGEIRECLNALLGLALVEEIRGLDG